MVLAATLAVAPATAVGTCDPGQMPDVLPTADMTAGMTGTGYTVVQGTTPVSFDVEILGVEQGLILPGHAFVLVKLSGPVIDQTGGIAAGMSGSPVYINDQLAGALAYGIYGDDTLAGMTPAEEMVKLFNDPSATPAASALPQTVRLSSALRRDVARAEGRPLSAAPATARAIPTPLAVSGLNGRGLRKFTKLVGKLKLNVIPYAAQAAAVGQPLAPTPLEPGDSYSAVISTGDLTSGGIGTETATCGNLSIAFGNPFFFAGPTSFGLNGAYVVTTVADQIHQYSYKWADITEPHGTIDQDRFVGIRGIDGVYPDVVPITSQVSNPDLGSSRSGETDVLRQDFVSYIAPFHLLANQDSMFDRIGDGTDTVSFIIQGKRADGSPWTLVRTNMFFSPYDASFAGILELANDVGQIASNPFEKVTFTSIHEEASITQRHLTTQIKNVQWATKESPVFSSHPTIEVRPGQVIRLRVSLLKPGASTPSVVRLSILVPDRARGGGDLVVRGGSSGVGFFSGGIGPTVGGGGGGSTPKSFDDLLTQLANAEHGNDLIAQLDAPGVRRAAGEGKVVKQRSRVVLGERDFIVDLTGGGGGPVPCTPKTCGI
jgi:hypothetical protein